MTAIRRRNVRKTPTAARLAYLKQHEPPPAPAKFIALTNNEGRLHALDEEGTVWVFAPFPRVWQSLDGGKVR